MTQIVSAMVLMGWAAAALANPQAPTPAPQAPQATFRAGVELVTVTASVRDGNGKVIRGLRKTDFEVLDSGVRREIRDFYVGDSPISLAILLDISGSMAVGGNMDRAREAVAMTTMNLRDKNDEASLFTFDSKLQRVVDFTQDLARVRRVSLEGTPWGKTSLYDAVAETAKQVAGRDNKHRALLVITDGVDTASRMSGAQVSAVAASIQVPVYLLTVVNPLDHVGGEFAALETESKLTETATLADLARWTGGDMRISSVPAHTVEAVQSILAQLRFQYLISFEPSAVHGWHPLEIRTLKKNFVVYARSGYRSGPSRTGS